MPAPQIAVHITGQNNLGPALVVLQKQLTVLQRTIGRSSITGAGEAAVSSIGPMLIPQLDGLSKWIDANQKVAGDLEFGLADLR